MSYIRYNTILPSGKRSQAYVIGADTSLVNFVGGSIPYSTIRKWFSSKTDEEFKKALSNGLGLYGEELDVVCERLFKERDKGEWDKPFEFEKKFKQ